MTFLFLSNQNKEYIFQMFLFNPSLRNNAEEVKAKDKDS